jgi:hypothetical protein
MWIISAVCTSIRMLLLCRSPSPMMYPTMEFAATDRVYASRRSYLSCGVGNFSRKKWYITGLKLSCTLSYVCRSCSRVVRARSFSAHSRLFQSRGRYSSCAPFCPPTVPWHASRYSDSSVVLSTHSSTPAAGVSGTTR